MTASDRNPWRTLLSVWGGAARAVWRLPLLIVGCLLMYTFLSGYWGHDLPFDVPRGFASQAGYILLHALVFAPLILATILMMTRGKVRNTEIWVNAAVFVGVIIALRELGILVLTSSLRLLRSHLLNLQFGYGMPAHDIKLYVISGIYLLIECVPLLAVFLLSVRLILLLPFLALAETGWKEALPVAWREMRGHYGFALVVSIAALLPMVVSDRLLGGIYGRLSMPTNLPVPLPAIQWEALLVRSAQLTIDYMIFAALSAGIYLAIRPRSAATAPSPSHTSLAHRPAL